MPSRLRQPSSARGKARASTTIFVFAYCLIRASRVAALAPRPSTVSRTRLVLFDTTDLRLRDNPALLDAAATGDPIALGFVWSEELSRGAGGVRGAARARGSVRRVAATLHRGAVVRPRVVAGACVVTPPGLQRRRDAAATRQLWSWGLARRRHPRGRRRGDATRTTPRRRHGDDAATTPRGRDATTTQTRRLSQAYLAESVRALADAAADSYGATLAARAGPSWADACAALAKEVGATVVHRNRPPDARAAEREALLVARLALDGVGVAPPPRDSALLLYPPEAVADRLKPGFSGGHWGTLMWFVRACRAAGEPAKPQDAPATLALAPAPAADAAATALVAPRYPQSNDWGARIREAHPAGEAAARKALDAFAAKGYARYERDRSRADLAPPPAAKGSAAGATARISHHLVRGELSPRDVYWACRRAAASDAGPSKTFDRRIHWRDLAYYQLHCFPEMGASPGRSQSWDRVDAAVDFASASRGRVVAPRGGTRERRGGGSRRRRGGATRKFRGRRSTAFDKREEELTGWWAQRSTGRLAAPPRGRDADIPRATGRAERTIDGRR